MISGNRVGLRAVASAPAGKGDAGIRLELSEGRVGAGAPGMGWQENGVGDEGRVGRPVEGPQHSLDLSSRGSGQSRSFFPGPVRGWDKKFPIREAHPGGGRPPIPI